MKLETLKKRLAKVEAEIVAASSKSFALKALISEARLAQAKVASDYRIVITEDDSWCWSSTKAMLEDVLGDYSADDACGADWHEHYPSKEAWQAARAAVEESNQRWIDAFEGNGVFERNGGIYAYSAALYVVAEDGELEDEPVDSCSGFFACAGDGAPVAQIRDQLQPSDVKGEIEIDDCSW